MGSPLPINVWSLVQHLLLDNSRQMGLIISAALALSGAVALMMWLYGSAYRAVLPGLSDRDAGEVVAALEQSGVDFKIDSITGDIKVPEGRVHEIRLLLAGQGLPRGASDNMLGRETSMELGRSKSEETAWLQRVRESEMARTISSLSSVQSARVHLAIPRQSVFIRERTQTSASVVLQVYPGRVLSMGEVEAIAHLVASSVPGLNPEKISIINQRGRLLNSTGGEGSMSNIIARLDYARRVEERYAHHIEELLTPIVGVNRVRAKVTANIDFTQTEETKERYIPGEQVVRSEKLHEERILNEVEGGVPGAVSNQPPAAQAADGSAIALAGDGAFPDARKKLLKRTRNFEVGKVVSRTQKVPGRLERLSVAVVIDNGLRPVEQQPTDAGQSDTQADAAKDPANAGRGEIDAARLAELTELVKEAIGFDEARGDRVKIMTSQFPGELAEVVPSWWENSQLQSMAKLGIAVIAGLLILLVVVRPLVKSAVRVPDVPRLGGPANQVQAIQNSNGQVEDERIHEGEVMHVNYQPDATSDTSFEGLLLAAQKVTDNDPQRVARAIQLWLDKA